MYGRISDYLGFTRPQSLIDELQRVLTEKVFEPKVLLLKNLGFIAPTAARRISYEETVRFEHIHERVYRSLGFEIIWIRPGSLSDRIQEIKLALSIGRIGE